MRFRALVAAAVAALFVTAGFALALEEGADVAPVRREEAPREVDPRTVGVGELVPDLELTLAAGGTKRLSELSGPKGLVVLARSESCPVGRKQGPGLAEIESAAKSLGLGLVYLNVAPGDDAATASTAAKDYGLAAPYALDPRRVAAAALGVRSTTEAFVLDRARTLVYRGAIDDRYGVGWERAAADRRWLLRGIEAAAAGRRPLVEATTAPGCAVTLGAPAAPGAPEASPAPPAAPPTWHGRVSRIVDRNCVDCHREGEAGPFPLVTREDVLAQADMVRVVVADRTMPPWFAGEACGEFATDAGLPARDRRDLVAWLDADGPEGDPRDAVVPLVRESGWRIGKPDVVFEAQRAFDVPAEGVIDYQYQTVETAVEGSSDAEDRWVTAIEVRPSAPQVVHHILVFARFRRNDPRAKTQGTFDGGLTGYFAAAVPGKACFVYPEGYAKRLPAGMDLLLQVHYTPNGKPARDRPRIGLVLSKEPPAHEVRTRGVYDRNFRIPPGAPRHPVHSVWTFPEAGRILEFMPHMHLRGAAFRYELELADGSMRTLLDIPRFDFDWQLVYRLREPLAVPRGARIHATGWFDNSAANPANPDPKREVPFGEQTSDEMMIGYFDWVD